MVARLDRVEPPPAPAELPPAGPASVPSPASSPSASWVSGLRPIMNPCRSARRVGTWCSGVPVITSSPKPASAASTGTAAHLVTRCTSGAAAT